jgi:hypothetical protein
MSQESLQTIFIIVAAVALLLQAIVLVGLALLMFELRKPVADIIRNASEIAGIARRRADDLDLTLAQISRITQMRAEQADTVARELLDRGHEQAVAADRLVGDLLRKFEHATDEAERIVQEPLRRVHALSAGFRAGFGYLFSRGRARTNPRGA